MNDPFRNYDAWVTREPDYDDSDYDDDDEDEVTYKIVRFHADDNHPDHHTVVRTGLTLEEAQEHCNDEATHGHDLDGNVEWFDGYTEE